MQLQGFRSPLLQTPNCTIAVQSESHYRFLNSSNSPNMISAVITLLVLCGVLNVNSIYHEQPDFVKTCRLGDEDFVNCSTMAVQMLFDTIPKGIPEIGLQQLDPLEVAKIKILQGSGPVNVNASLTNVTVLGFGKTKINMNTVDPETYNFYTELKLPRLRIDGNYVLLGRILVIPLRGTGKCWFDAKNLDIIVKSDVKLTQKENRNFFRIEAIHVKFNIGGLRLYMGNLFDGIKALEETTNAYLNQNWKLVADSLNPILSKTIEDIMLDILRKIFDNIPAEYFISDVKV